MNRAIGKPVRKGSDADLHLSPFFVILKYYLFSFIYLCVCVSTDVSG